jgi:hypothetical protein
MSELDLQRCMSSTLKALDNGKGYWLLPAHAAAVSKSNFLVHRPNDAVVTPIDASLHTPTAHTRDCCCYGCAAAALLLLGFVAAGLCCCWALLLLLCYCLATSRAATHC